MGQQQRMGENQTMVLNPAETRRLRQDMIQNQLVTRGIHDANVLGAMEQIPREYFVENQPMPSIYWDGPLAIGCGQTISQPYMVAIMASLLQLQGKETVLEVGAGSGYGAAVLALLAKKVVAIERIPSLLQQAKNRWQGLGLNNITGICADGSLGCPQYAPYDGISVTAAPANIPPSLVAQLQCHTGRLVIPVGPRSAQMLQVVQRDQHNKINVHNQFPCVFVPLLGQEGWADHSGVNMNNLAST